MKFYWIYIGTFGSLIYYYSRSCEVVKKAILYNRRSIKVLSINLTNRLAKNNIEAKRRGIAKDPRLSTNIFYSHSAQLIFWVQWECNRTKLVLHGCVRVGFLRQVCCTVFFVPLSNNSTSFWRVGAGAKNDESSTRVGEPPGVLWAVGRKRQSVAHGHGNCCVSRYGLSYTRQQNKCFL